MARRSPTERLDDFQRRHPWAGFPIAVVYKFVDDQGSYLAALITYYGFLSLFPLLLLLTSILGVVLANNPQLQQEILQSALRQFPVIGSELGNPKGLGGGVTAIVIGSLTALYGALGVAQATQNAMNQIWAVPRVRRPDPITARLRGLLLLLTAGLALLGATVLSAMGTRSNAAGAGMSWLISILLVLASVLVNAVVLLLAFRVSTADHLTLRQVAPGAITAAILWQLLQSFGAQYVSQVVKNASATNSVSALVLGLLAFIFLASNALVLSVEINSVRAKHLYPRALMTPFTENVDLTGGDQEVYADAAKAQRLKTFQNVDVSFDNDGQQASAKKKQVPPKS
ncbi:MAG TPA: YhjD/YihY/BrkB family envelope integrity protein [Propionibacteriaceae bacterium]